MYIFLKNILADEILQSEETNSSMTKIDQAHSSMSGSEEVVPKLPTQALESEVNVNEVPVVTKVCICRLCGKEGSSRGFIENHLDKDHFYEKLLELVPQPVSTISGLLYSCPEQGCSLTCHTKWNLAKHLSGRLHGYRDKFLKEALKEVAETCDDYQETVTSEYVL